MNIFIFLDYIVPVAILIMAMLLMFVLVKKRKSDKYSSQAISYAAVCVALATVLNFFTLFPMPNGGSVTAGRLVPLLIYAYIFRKEKGFLAGAVYGLIDFIAKPYFVNFFQFLLDYIFAFSCVGFAGVMSLKLKHYGMIIGAVICGLARFAFSTVSGILYFNTGLVPSMAYNSILLIDTAVCIAVISLLMISKTFRKQLNVTHNA